MQLIGLRSSSATFVLLLLVLVPGCGDSIPPEDVEGSTDSALSIRCADGTEPSLEVSGGCAPIEDVAGEPSAVDPSLPDLESVRSGVAPTAATAAGVTCTGLGNQTGTLYNFAALKMGSGTKLQTKMIVHPEGIGNTTSCDIFTTATNRTQHGVEVVGIYAGPGSTPQLGIFDWSCSKTAPCTNGSHRFPSPAWVRSWSFAACWMHTETDGDGHNERFIYYSNQTQKLNSANPPTWKNSVLLWNYCSRKWQLVYSHSYRATNGDGGGWGPVIEPHISGPLPFIKEVGFKSSTLFHNGSWTTLGPNVTTFRTPAAAGMTNWHLVFRTPNQSYAVVGGCPANEHACGTVCCPATMNCNTCVGP